MIFHDISYEIPQLFREKCCFSWEMVAFVDYRRLSRIGAGGFDNIFLA